MFSVLVIRLRSLRLLRVSGIVMRLRMFLLLITFLKARSEERRVGKECRSRWGPADEIKEARLYEEPARTALVLHSYLSAPLPSALAARYMTCRAPPRPR